MSGGLLLFLCPLGCGTEQYLALGFNAVRFVLRQLFCTPGLIASVALYSCCGVAVFKKENLYRIWTTYAPKHKTLGSGHRRTVIVFSFTL